MSLEVDHAFTTVRPSACPYHRRPARQGRLGACLDHGAAVMSQGIIGQALGLFAVTNIDDIVVLALFFA
jgi:hypothetical protein